MSARDRGDFWVTIGEDLKRLQSEEPPDVEESAERLPCLDESCLGTLGEDGLCRLCGKGPEASPEPGSATWQKEPESSAQPDMAQEEEPKQQERVCCSDESCVGTVDEDGYCRICGLKWKEGGYLEGEILSYREDALS